MSLKPTKRQKELFNALNMCAEITASKVGEDMVIEAKKIGGRKKMQFQIPFDCQIAEELEMSIKYAINKAFT